MKKFLLLFLFTTITNAQIINIPDVNFKSNLLQANPGYNIAIDQFGNTIRIDANFDNEIQVTEALAVYKLNLGIYTAGITDLTGILEFRNLKSLGFSGNYIVNLNLNGLDLEELSCSFCHLSSIDLSVFPNLKNLECSNNNLTSLDLSQVPNLENLTCRYNQLTMLDLQYTPKITTLNCQNNNISSLNLNYIPDIVYIYADGNNLSNLDLSNVVKLNTLGCGYNPITNLNLSNLPVIEAITCASSQLTSLDLSNVPTLKQLVCSYNQISSLDTSNLPNLISFWCTNNLLTSLNLNNNPLINGLLCSDNQITNIIKNNTYNDITNIDFSNNSITSFDFTNMPNLTYIKCQNNQLTNLDLNNLHSLNQLDCSSNNLTNLSIKNGSVENNLNFSNNPSLTFICLDDSQVVTVQNQLNGLSMNYTVCNSYCSFTPGGNHNIINGHAKFDFNNNGCDISDSLFPLIKFKINDGYNDLGATATNLLGIYTFYTELLYDMYIMPDVENLTWFNFSPSIANVLFADNNNNIANRDFCITANGVHNDVEVVVVPISRARPGFNSEYKIVYKNKGNQTLSGNVNFTYNEAILDYLSATTNPDIQSTGSLTWNYSNLLPFETRSIYIDLNVNSPTETPAVNIGDLLNFTATVNPIAGDETPTDNSATFDQIVVGAYDPNFIECIEGDNVSTTKIGEYLHYVINFENTGTAAAENVVVKDVFDISKYDIASLQVMSSSNPVNAKITGNKVEFIFENINLVANQHGDVVFKIKSKSDLVSGDVASTKADIFFDYNFPIVTNDANTTFQTLSRNDFEIDPSVKIYPNPSKGNVSVKANGIIKSVQLFDIQGRILETRMINEQELNMDISKYTNGVYFLKVLTDIGIKIEKLVKE